MSPHGSFCCCWGGVGGGMISVFRAKKKHQTLKGSLAFPAPALPSPAYPLLSPTQTLKDTHMLLRWRHICLLDFLHLFWQCRGICSSSGWGSVPICAWKQNPSPAPLTHPDEREDKSCCFLGTKCLAEQASKLVGVCPRISWNTQLHFTEHLPLLFNRNDHQTPWSPAPQLFAAFKEFWNAVTDSVTYFHCASFPQFQQCTALRK